MTEYCRPQSAPWRTQLEDELLQDRKERSLPSAVAVYTGLPGPDDRGCHSTRMELLWHWAKTVMLEREQGAGGEECVLVTRLYVCNCECVCSGVGTD